MIRKAYSLFYRLFLVKVHFRATFYMINNFKWIVCLGLAMLSQVSNAENIVFEDDAVKTICVGNWDQDKDGELSIEEAASVAYLSSAFSFNSTIKCFDELRFFTGLTLIGNYEFINCSSLEHITIPAGVTQIKTQAFFGCSSLMNVTIPGNVASIGDLAFDGCSGLTQVVFESGVQSIGEKAFYYCSSLSKVDIPATMTSISSDAFGSCENLGEITIDLENNVYDSRENCNAIIKTGTNTLLLGCKNSTIPDGVTAIGAAAFIGCAGLTSIEIPSSVITIGASAFSGCKGLTAVSIPSSVVELGSNAFVNCTSLSSLYLSEGVAEMGRNTFTGCSSLTEVTLPSTITYIGTDAFSDCPILFTVHVMFKSPLKISASTFSTRRAATLYVPIGCVDAFKSADYWKDFKSIVEWFPMGDVNHDGSVNVLDVTLVIDYILDKKPENFHYEEANVNGDEYINVLDVTKIIDIILGK